MALPVIELDPNELRVLRKQTTHFIKQNPTDVTIERAGNRVPDGQGGFTQVPGAPGTPQRMRKVIQGGNVATRNIDGVEITPAFVFICEFDADIRTGDEFELGGLEYHVIFVRDDRRYETWAEVAQRG